MSTHSDIYNKAINRFLTKRHEKMDINNKPAPKAKGGWGQAIGGIGGALLGMLGAGQQHRRQKELMDIQNRNQQALNKQGHDLQFDMWNKTNAKAQVEHYKQAGLNPGLMYGQSGAGGTTGSQGGGSAAGGQAPLMDIGASAMQGAMMKAQIDNINADTKLKDADATKTGGVDTDLGNQQIQESITRLDKIIAETSSTRTIEALNKVKKELTESMITTEGLKQQNIQADTTLKGATTKLQAEQTAKTEIEKALIQANIGKTNAEKTAIATRIQQDWIRIANDVKGLDIKDKEQKIKNYQAKINAEYPGLWNMIGSGIREFIGVWDSMTGKERTGYGEPNQ